MTVPLLLTAAGAAMVGLAVPKLYNASDTAGRTFDHQVEILERGAQTGSVGRGGGGAPASGFDFGGVPTTAPNYQGTPTSVVGTARTSMTESSTQLTGSK